jgi:hypothetical protein
MGPYLQYSIQSGTYLSYQPQGPSVAAPRQPAQFPCSDPFRQSLCVPSLVVPAPLPSECFLAGIVRFGFCCLVRARGCGSLCLLRLALLLCLAPQELKKGYRLPVPSQCLSRLNACPVCLPDSLFSFVMSLRTLKPAVNGHTHIIFVVFSRTLKTAVNVRHHIFFVVFSRTLKPLINGRTHINRMGCPDKPHILYLHLEKDGRFEVYLYWERRKIRGLCRQP